MKRAATQQTKSLLTHLTQSTLMLPLLHPPLPQPLHLLMPDTPQTPRHTNNTTNQRQIVRTSITVPSISTDHLTSAAALTSISAVRVRVLVQNASIHEVEDVA